MIDTATTETTASATKSPEMFGRRLILTDQTEITDSNILSVLNKAIVDHRVNQTEIDYLWKYYKGRQPILDRIKLVRPEINNKVVENHANEIVSFKTGYLCGEPIQYVSREGDKDITTGIKELNDDMVLVNKSALDYEVAEWQHFVAQRIEWLLNPERQNRR